MSTFPVTPGDSYTQSQFNNHLDALRQRILKIITEMIEKNRYILLDKLMAIAARETSSGRAEIEKVVDELIKNKVIVAGSRLVRENILKNPLRKEIHTLVKENPGINLNTIKSKLNLGSREVAWHLGVLVKFGCVQKIYYKNTNLFALNKVDPNEAILLFLLRRDIMGNILAHISSTEMGLADLEAHVGEEKTKILYNLRLLHELGVIEKKEGDPNKHIPIYCIHPDYHAPLKEALIFIDSTKK